MFFPKQKRAENVVLDNVHQGDEGIVPGSISLLSKCIIFFQLSLSVFSSIL